VCFVIAAFVYLVGASVAVDTVPASWRVAAFELMRRSLSALALPPASSVAGRCSLPCRPARGAEAQAPLGQGMVHDFFSPFAERGFEASLPIPGGLRFPASGKASVDPC
jgi:hypothetical protein